MDRVDNFSDLAPNLSGYRYAFNNPVNVTDPDGNFEYTDGYGTYDSKNSTGAIEFSGVYQNQTKQDGCPPNCGGDKGKTNSPNWSAAIPMAATLSAADGPLPVGEVAAIAMLSGLAIDHYFGEEIRGLSANMTTYQASAVVSAALVVAKAREQLKELAKRNFNGPNGYVYVIITTKTGAYENKHFGLPSTSINLNAGEIWKIGETTDIQRRLNQYGGPIKLANQGLLLRRVDNGGLTQMQAKAMEKVLLASYVVLYGTLPPGNTVEFR